MTKKPRKSKKSEEKASTRKKSVRARERTT